MNNAYILKKIVPEINEINTLKHLKIVNVMLSNVISIFFEINNEIHFWAPLALKAWGGGGIYTWGV